MKIKYISDTAPLELNCAEVKVVREDKVTYCEKDKVIKTGEGDDDFIIEKVVVEESRCDRDEYINSFSDEAGIENIIKKVQITGNTALLNQVPTVYADTTNQPTCAADAQKIVEDGKKLAEANGIGFSQEELDKYVKAAVEAALKAKEIKEEN